MAFKLEVSDMASIASEYASQLGGVFKRNMNGYPAFVNCKCPKCGKNIAGLYASRNSDNWILGCPSDKCKYRKSLYHSIQESGIHHLETQLHDLYNKKRDENYVWWYERKYGWKPIKSRNCRTHHKVENQSKSSSKDGSVGGPG
jgi:hypothetical protein